jgi:hypothetical protein
MYLNIMKVIFGKTIVNVILNKTKAEIIFSKVRNKTGVSLFLVLVNIVLELLARVIRQEKEIK